jgi:hypothetical protein
MDRGCGDRFMRGGRVSHQTRPMKILNRPGYPNTPQVRSARFARAWRICAAAKRTAAARADDRPWHARSEVQFSQLAQVVELVANIQAAKRALGRIRS